MYFVKDKMYFVKDKIKFCPTQFNSVDKMYLLKTKLNFVQQNIFGSWLFQFRRQKVFVVVWYPLEYICGIPCSGCGIPMQ